MNTISVILLLLASVIASSAAARASAVALPLVQIMIGALGSSAFGFSTTLEPDMFLLLFVAPLLFLDGWRIPKEELFRDSWTIFALAFGLVVFTVAGIGIFIHWLIPAVPLAVAFALAAVLSPTDAVAVSAIAERTPMPERLRHILEGESLLNDASGLVCMRFAVAAALTGTFSPTDALGTFLWLAGGGVATGALVAILANAAKDGISRRFGEETGSQILISLLIPFGAYLLAEHLAASGILAAVAAGIAMGYEERSGRATAITRIRRAAVWDAVQFAGNGVIFVLLGQQLPGIVAGAGRVAQEAAGQSEWWLAIPIVAVTAALLALRMFWATAILGLMLVRRDRHEAPFQVPVWRLAGVTSLAGVRGALALSGVMAFPLALPDGSAFPARDLAILLAASVILASLITANAGLPCLMRGVMPVETQARQKSRLARTAAAGAAIRVIERHLVRGGEERPDTELLQQAGERILAHYRERIDTWAKMGEDIGLALRRDGIERHLHLLALGAERDEIHRLAAEGELPEELARALVRDVDLRESLCRAR